MSRTTMTTLRVVVPTAYQLLMREIMPTCRGLQEMPSHAALAALAGDTSTPMVDLGNRGAIGPLPSELARLEARNSAILAEPAIAVAARTADPTAWSRAQSLLGESRRALRSSPASAASLAERGDRALRSALESGARALAVEERTLAASIMDQTLRSIGCRTTIAESRGATGIWAERDHHLVAVLIEDGGRVELDHAGCESDHCAPLHQEIALAVAAQGGTFEDAEVVEHGDAAGGALIQNATRAAGARGDIARAIAEQATTRPRARFSRRREQTSVAHPLRNRSSS